MKTRLPLIIASLIGFTLVARASITEKTELLDKGERGVAEKLTVMRDGIVVYERYRMDRERDGTYENCVETFSVSERKVVSFTLMRGARGTVIRQIDGAQVIFSSEKDSWRPDGVMIELKGKATEFYSLQTEGFYYPVADNEKARLKGINDAGDELLGATVKGDVKAVIEAVKKLQDSPLPKD